MQGGLVSIKETYHTLKPQERTVADFILEHPEQIVKMSVQKLAELTGVSEATIVRLSRSLHFKGFQDLKMRIVADLAQTAQASMDTDSYQEIQVNSSVSALINSISHNNIQSIQDTLSVLSEQDVERAIDVIGSTRKICIFGIGASGVIAEDFMQKLTRIDRWCEAAYDFNSQATLAANLKAGDVAFGISYSGQTEDIIGSLSIAKQNGATIISLTKFGNNPVSELADIRLFTSSLEKSIRSGAMASRITQLNVIDILYVGIAQLKYDETVQLLERTRIAVSRSKRNG
ncbi:MurR/RpiR family transcriptional regulator [Cohnella abietis]|uniref:Putative HTH-type transcriptional regulator n=1 Tax=Cohnella abietis TaxID=2507935 RepID=A0A3T1DEF1_9BACL|nr:MurR/RpiR family transcriptional regulator [Cohnella abietis]BBI36487.1 putative HTH-type transcriptional regulator [Cohnella abietis]